ALPFFAQDAGYYVSWLLNDEYARIELDNYLFGWASAKKERDHLHKTNADLRLDLAMTEHELRKRDQLIDEIHQSTSWKITKPLRKLKEAMGKKRN
ncbi:MAG: hypothetical protein LBG81_06155, partial [Coriobacteriaceae bacterium]|nr:hypothetical protein [Coriobacteriaceae bacterium]